MNWEERLLGLFEDLEQQAEGLALADRDAEVEELGRAEYAAVELASRLHASTGRSLRLTVCGAGQVSGRLTGVGAGWCLLSAEEASSHDRVVSLPALLSARGLSSRAVPEPARSVVSRLRVGSVLRRIADSGEPVVIGTVAGEQRPARVLRVGADFLEITTAEGALEVLPFSALAVVRRT